ncbi:hypothetical protein D0T49_12665 [Paludibacter sp. 221]|uniref:hypothetical protein n=1 Tax=Paludibacter sp. 221 TaxID=2302939 RepID=UPI0013D23E6B|nr:hypothetical protein [Paludibacter sp. 221]NDV47899.1 hypothetical protein [Paludibacter sp. 221]
MTQFIVENIDNQTAKNEAWLILHSGRERKKCCLGKIPEDVNPDILKHKIVLFVNIEDKGKYYFANWLDMVILNREDIEQDSPLLKIKLKGDIDSKQLLSRLLQIVSETEMPPFWKVFFKSDAVAEAIKDYEKFPAGAKVHHPWENGLSSHTEEALTAYAQLSKVYYLKEIKHHVCIAALLFHDWGKTLEYSLTSSWSYTDDMPLFGHVYMSAKKICSLLNEFRQGYDFENEEQERQAIRDIQFAEHCILAHHGIKGYGSPVVPATVEAFMVHIADLISARVQMFDMATHMEQNNYLGTMIIKE